MDTAGSSPGNGAMSGKPGIGKYSPVVSSDRTNMAAPTAAPRHCSSARCIMLSLLFFIVTIAPALLPHVSNVSSGKGTLPRDDLAAEELTTSPPWSSPETNGTKELNAVLLRDGHVLPAPIRATPDPRTLAGTGMGSSPKVERDEDDITTYSSSFRSAGPPITSTSPEVAAIHETSALVGKQYYMFPRTYEQLKGAQRQERRVRGDDGQGPRDKTRGLHSAYGGVPMWHVEGNVPPARKGWISALMMEVATYGPRNILAGNLWCGGSGGAAILIRKSGIRSHSLMCRFLLCPTRGLCTRHQQARLRMWPSLITWDQTLRRGVDFEGLLCMHCTRIRRASLTRLHSANCKGEVCRYVFRSSPASHCQRASGEGGNVRGTADAPMMWRHSRPPTYREAGNQHSLGTERMP